jgi:hypothetical protein
MRTSTHRRGAKLASNAERTRNGADLRETGITRPSMPDAVPPDGLAGKSLTFRGHGVVAEDAFE